MPGQRAHRCRTGLLSLLISMRAIPTVAPLLGTTFASGQVATTGTGGGNPPPADTTLTANGRALPAPLPSLPFSSGEWVGPVIGAPDKTALYPLQKALGGQADSKYRMYGWLNLSYTTSISKNSNIPVAYNVQPNALMIS